MATLKPIGYIVVDLLGEQEEPATIGPFPVREDAEAWCKVNIDTSDPWQGTGVYEVKPLYSPLAYSAMLANTGI